MSGKLDISDIIYNAFEDVMGEKSCGLSESRHAPKREKKVFAERPLTYYRPVSKPTQPPGSRFYFPTCIIPLKPTRRQPKGYKPGITCDSYNSFTPTKMADLAKDYPVANIDDAAGFMAFARALREKQAREAGTASKQTEAASGQQNGNTDAWGDLSTGAATGNETAFASGSNDAWPADSHSVNNNNGFGDDSGNNNSTSVTSGVSEGAETPKAPASGFNAGVAEFVPQGNNTVVASQEAHPVTTVVTSQEAHPVTTTGTSDNTAVEEEENRENLTTFKTWGAPAARDKPAAQVRRVIIKGLPTSWSTPTKVLSLIHGGMVENISITPSGNNAHVLFCDHEACKAFYDKYPNGIDLDKDKRKTVFVEMGKEVDVISSQLSFNLSIGSTRVVRAIGVGMNITMAQLLKLATANNRKVEKIVDSCVPGDARNVIFRFCSIDDAVKFRASIIRDADWEHCNIQHAADPCELATGFHAD